VHCYRMLGSFQDAEDALQDTLLAAWQGLAGFQGRASIRTWHYRIATNRCLDVRRAASRRPAKDWNLPEVEPPEPTRLGEVAWLEPFPDALLEDAIDLPTGPEARYEQTETISLAFVTALQVLPPRQVAVLVLRDVTDALRIRGPRCRRPLLRQPVPRMPEVRPRANASQRSASVWSLPTRVYRHPSRSRPLRAHPQRHPHLRTDPLREHRAPMVRAPAIAPELIESFRAVGAPKRHTNTKRMCAIERSVHPWNRW
jgi:RNA polymerase sigma factor (sigma-70 family)